MRPTPLIETESSWAWPPSAFSWSTVGNPEGSRCREICDRQVAARARKPKAMREMEIWRTARAERDERLARRIARASQSQQDDTEGGDPSA